MVILASSEVQTIY